jgi:hypothetical protein
LDWIDEADKKTGKSTRMDLVAFIEKGGVAYIKDSYGNLAYLVVKTSSLGNKFVKTVADGKKTGNLLYLPECP